MTIRRFLLIGLAWGLAMFAYFLYALRDRSTQSILILVALGMCLLGGVLFGVVMFGFVKIIARVAGFDISKTQRSKLNPRNLMLIGAATFPALAIVWFVVLFQFEFLWVALAAGLGPSMVLLPGAVNLKFGFAMFVRTIGSVLVGVLMAAAAGALLLSFELTPAFISTCLAYSLAWTIAQVISMFVRPLWKQPSASET